MDDIQMKIMSLLIIGFILLNSVPIIDGVTVTIEDETVYYPESRYDIQIQKLIHYQSYFHYWYF